MMNQHDTIDKKIFYAQAVYGTDEINAVMEAFKNPFLSNGPFSNKFEVEVSKLFGKKHGVFVNSGSSANLLAMTVMNLPKGGEVITPACTFSTTLAPIIQNGLIPVFVDCELGKYVPNVENVLLAHSNKTVAIVMPQLIGNVFDMESLRNETDIPILDDSCDTLFPRMNGKLISQFSSLTTTSFYGSHVITAMGTGGMVMTDDDHVRDRLKSLRDWGRGGTDCEDFDKRFNEVDDFNYDVKSSYVEFGYNMKVPDAAAAFGLVQLSKFQEFKKIRCLNFSRLKDFFQKYEDWFYLPIGEIGVTNVPLAFPLTIKENAPFKRYDFLKHMESRQIQTRVLFSGNVLRHPIMKNQQYKVFGLLENSDTIMRGGFLLGCHHGLKSQDIDYIIDSAEDFLKVKS